MSRFLPRACTALLLALAAVVGHGRAAAETAARVPAVLAPASPESLGFSSARLARLDRYIDGEIAAQRKAGAVVLLARHGRIAYFKAYGAADIASGRALRTDDYFRWWTMTKPITSVALLTLYEQGKFQLTDPVAKYIPAFGQVRVYTGVDADGKLQLTDLVRPITIQDLFRHTAGLTYGGVFADTPVDKAYKAAGIAPFKLESLQEMVAKITTVPLLYQPGTRYVYSYAHDVLAYLVEYFSGMRFDAYCQQVIFAPLGMHETAFGIPAGREHRYSTSYRRGKDGGLEPSTDAAGEDFYAYFNQHPSGGAGLGGPPRDYLRFAQMLLNGGELGGVRILSPKTVELMTADNLVPGTPGVQDGMRHGLGVWVVTDVAQFGGLASAGQYGRGGIATTYFANDPKEQLVMLLFAQYFPLDQPFVDTWMTLVYQALVR